MVLYHFNCKFTRFRSNCTRSIGNGDKSHLLQLKILGLDCTVYTPYWKWWCITSSAIKKIKFRLYTVYTLYWKWWYNPSTAIAQIEFNLYSVLCTHHIGNSDIIHLLQLEGLSLDCTVYTPYWKWWYIPSTAIAQIEFSLYSVSVHTILKMAIYHFNCNFTRLIVAFRHSIGNGDISHQLQFNKILLEMVISPICCNWTILSVACRHSIGNGDISHQLQFYKIYI